MKHDISKDIFVFQISDLLRMMKQHFVTEEGTEVTRSQIKLLITVWRNPGITQQGLAKQLEIANMSVCRQVDTLEERGMLERKTDPKDRRARRLFTTEKTVPVIKEAIEHLKEVSELFLTPLDKDERDMLIRFLNRMIEYRTTHKAGGKS
ncbi:MarR family winged helix-turn-helix transcriptional regulator [Kordiimonas pumila]|uniref:MarR family winged helix-turn-helix transcriptional regulator n=1 Tax=Kordiimonas pumila TaxID=2161677 RepID=A0ABV7D7S3_9PROT|nr:MarR family transcriptional regulator [Kordiimonas pumila]